MRCLLAFREWLDRRGVVVNDAAIEIRDVASSWGIFARQDVQEGTLLGWIPCTAVLSTKNTDIADLLEREGIESGLALVVAVAYERRRGNSSPW